MAEECTIGVGSHSNFGTFVTRGYSKTSLGFGTIDKFGLTQPTTLKKIITNLEPV